MKIPSKFKDKQPHGKRKSRTLEERLLTKTDLPETDECELRRSITETNKEMRVRFPAEKCDRVQIDPAKFKVVENALEAFERQERLREVDANSIESIVGYNSLMRLLGKVVGQRIAYYQSEEGGKLPLKEARERAYRQDLESGEGIEMVERLLSMPASRIDYGELLDLHGFYPAAAENIWELMKREAKREFESGHRAAEALEPADYFKHAWDRASYMGLRESLCDEWQPKGGIELSMIDAIAQAWIMMEFWTKESALRALTPARLESPAFIEWAEKNKGLHAGQWSQGNWHLPTLDEHKAVENAAQMADRWQRMYFRAIRNLRDWRRYTPQLTINNAQQVNIAGDGGQQINVANAEAIKKAEGEDKNLNEEEDKEKITKIKRITS